jgi:hypothetical protein
MMRNSVSKEAFVIDVSSLGVWNTGRFGIEGTSLSKNGQWDPKVKKTEIFYDCKEDFDEDDESGSGSG